MRVIDYLHSPELLRWAEARLKENNIKAKYDDDSAIVALLDDTKVLAVVIFSHYNGKNVEMSIVSGSTRWAGKDYIKACFEFAFEHLGCVHITTQVRADNHRSIRLTEGLGFTVEGRMRSAIVDFEENVYDGIIFGMLKNECGWL